MEKLLLSRLTAQKAQPEEALWSLARFYCEQRRIDDAICYLELLLERAADPEYKSGVLLAMGQAMEHGEQYAPAISYYMQAFALEPVQTRTWYLIHASLASSFNKLRLFEEAELYARRAVGIDPDRPEGHTQLGIAFQGQGQPRAAAEAFIRATRADASNARAFELLLSLLKANPDLGRDFAQERQCCEEAVKMAAAANRPPPARIYSGWRRTFLLWYWRIRQKFGGRP